MPGVRTIPIWLALVSAAAAQSREVRVVQKLGPLEVTIRHDELVVRRGAREWHIPMSRLPVRAADCDNPTEREHCEALPGQSACVECMYDPSPLAWDEARGSLYLAVATGMSKNRPWIILRYRLGDGQATRVMADYGAGFDMGTNGDLIALRGVSGVCSLCERRDMWHRQFYQGHRLTVAAICLDPLWN